MGVQAQSQPADPRCGASPTLLASATSIMAQERIMAQARRLSPLCGQESLIAIPANYDRSHQIAGSPFPLGANWDGQGVNFSLFSESSEYVEFCSFAPPGATHR